ncbi:vWA domain-containing protein [Nodularia spumigena]|uniref:vWA domain-containing protein n=1 Tax=Nodularia spumigena TaxID=70799 RepID=UPI002B2166BE|nr:vWA domain-containing protein [Nodularia spumigena]MEA5557659.1 vWA domain-containing protein [Nodularia spumigena CH309]
MARSFQRRSFSALALVLLSGAPAALAQIAPAATPPMLSTQEPGPDAPAPLSQESVIEVVFVLDTTGSMSGLLEGAKQKIWSIASTIATAQPRPTVRMGLVGYRDVGDAYVTTRTELTEDLDLVYAELMKFEAGGGGDTPESVNQALHEGVTKQPWSSDPNALKLIYLVGDAPPQMHYPQDVKYTESCSTAASSGIIINTIQCGTMAETTPVWQEIARLAEGEYFAIEQDGGVIVVATPFDADLARLGAQLGETTLGYGSRADQNASMRKRSVGREIADAAPVAAQAERANYLTSESGKLSAFGEFDLVEALRNNTVSLESIPTDELPEELRALSLDERKARIDTLTSQRAALQQQIAELAAKRDTYLKQELTTRGTKGGFDEKVVESLRSQAKRVGIRFQ